MQHLIYSIWYSVVPTNSSLITIGLVGKTIVYNNIKRWSLSWHNNQVSLYMIWKDRNLGSCSCIIRSSSTVLCIQLYWKSVKMKPLQQWRTAKQTVTQYYCTQHCVAACNGLLVCYKYVADKETYTWNNVLGVGILVTYIYFTNVHSSKTLHITRRVNCYN